uniref:C2H2-type domain-containing protein n=1 Tax=Neogobius melanostomus TaxID=47308 RepID=A0A8C6TVN6_9GOBI
QKPLVKKEVDPSVELPVSTLPEPVGEQCSGEAPGCSLHLHPDNNEQHYSSSETDDSDDWEPATKRKSKSNEQDPDLVLIEDSNTGIDDENTLLSFASFSGNTNAMIDLQNQGLFNLPISLTETDDRPFRDSVCVRGFDQEAHLRSHMQMHTAKPIRCLVCSKEFSQRALLKRHMQTHSEEKSFSCPECGLRLKQQHNMHRHISAVHRREKPHSCLVCQKAFAQKSDLIIHMRMHTGEKPFVCAFCTKGFRVRHMRTHTDGHPFRCPECGMCFRQRYNVSRHVAVVHRREKPHMCTVCKKEFARKHDFVTHLCFNSGEKAFSCALCGKKFAYKSYLRKHEKKHKDKEEIGH